MLALFRHHKRFFGFYGIAGALIILVSGCSEPARQTRPVTPVKATADRSALNQADSAKVVPASAPSATAGLLTASAVEPASAATILARPQVPILCYHQVRDWTNRDSKAAKDYIIPVATFRAQMKMLADSGYQTILPDQLYAYLTTGAPLPPKPIMLTFDDTDLDQYTTAVPELNKYGYKAVFFIMTVALGRPRYMSRAQVKELADAGHVIGSHTWDHQNVKKLQGKDWVTQLDKPTEQLKAITGKEIKYFAYPFGLWSPAVIPELKKRGFVAAFQLATRRDSVEPLFTIRRTIASGYWSPRTLHTHILERFK